MKLNIIFTIALSALTLSSWAAEHIVEMKNIGSDGSSMVFEPGFLKVAVGDKVTFKATDPSHSSESIANLIPDGATSWQGPMSQDITVTIDKEGVYVYKCLPHTIMGMVGVIQAGKPTNLDQIKAASKALSASFVMNKDRLNHYLAQAK